MGSEGNFVQQIWHEPSYERRDESRLYRASINSTTDIKNRVYRSHKRHNELRLYRGSIKIGGKPDKPNRINSPDNYHKHNHQHFICDIFQLFKKISTFIRDVDFYSCTNKHYHHYNLQYFNIMIRPTLTYSTDSHKIDHCHVLISSFLNKISFYIW